MRTRKLLAMSMIGLPVGPARGPVTPHGETARAQLRQVLVDLGAVD